MRAVQTLDQIRLRLLQIGNELAGRQRLALAPPTDIVERHIAPDKDEPGGGIARWPVHRPILQCAQARFLERLFGPIEIAEIAQQCAKRLGTGGSQRRIDPGDIAHLTPLPIANERSGRISNAPVSSRPRSRAVAMASSSVAQSTT